MKKKRTKHTCYSVLLFDGFSFFPSFVLFPVQVSFLDPFSFFMCCRSTGRPLVGSQLEAFVFENARALALAFLFHFLIIRFFFVFRWFGLSHSFSQSTWILSENAFAFYLPVSQRTREREKERAKNDEQKIRITKILAKCKNEHSSRISIRHHFFGMLCFLCVSFILVVIVRIRVYKYSAVKTSVFIVFAVVVVIKFAERKKWHLRSS